MEFDGAEYNSQHFMTTYTDTQLKQALAKMLPKKKIKWSKHTDGDGLLWCGSLLEVLDTELLHLCWLVEETLTPHEASQMLACAQTDMSYSQIQIMPIGWPYAHRGWQQRTIALAKVKGVEII